jgi:hypothetical protein
MKTRKDRIRTFRFIHNACVLIALAALSACSRAPAPQQAFEGHWEGAVDFPDRKMPVILDVALGKDGRILAEADIRSEGLEDYPIELRVAGDSVWISLQSLEAGPEIRGRKDAGAQRIDGEFSLEQERFPIRFNRLGVAQLSAARKAFEAAPKKQVTVVSADGHELRDSFNRDAGKTRLLLFLSPT